MGSGRLGLGSGRPDLRSGRPDLRSAGGGDNKNENEKENENEKNGKIALCGIIGHLPLRGRCPKSDTSNILVFS